MVVKLNYDVIISSIYVAIRREMTSQKYHIRHNQIRMTSQLKTRDVTIKWVMASQFCLMNVPHPYTLTCRIIRTVVHSRERRQMIGIDRPSEVEFSLICSTHRGEKKAFKKSDKNCQKKLNHLM